MSHVLVLQTTYASIEVALTNAQSLIAQETIDKFQASAQLIPTINRLLHHHALKISDLTYIAVNQGPAPFTTLRVTITTANGIAYAQHTPLIGIDGMQALVTPPSPCATIVGLLNAFNHDLYFGIQRDATFKSGCHNGKQFLHHLSQTIPHDSIEFRGNGAALYQPLIQELFGNRAYIAPVCIEYATLETVAAMAHKEWLQKNSTSTLMPLYLKSMSL